MVSEGAELARCMRRHATAPERLLWQRLRDRRLAGLKFRRKALVGPRVVDFLCVERRLVVEVAGLAPLPRAVVEARVQSIQRAGCGVLRLPRRLVLEETDAACRRIARAAVARG